MVKKLWLILIYCLLFTLPVMAKEPNPTKVLGTLNPSNVILDFEGYQIETYKVLDHTYVPVYRLTEMGCNVNFNIKTGEVIINPNSNPPMSNSASLPSLNGKSYSLYQSPIWVGAFRTHGITLEDRVLIPIGALRQLWHIEINGPIYKMSPKIPLSMRASSSELINETHETLSLTITDLYWDNKWIKESNTYTLSPFEVLPRTLSHTNKLYISTIITKATTPTFTYTNENMYGQLNEALFKRYTQADAINLDNLGDPIDLSKVMWAEETVNGKNLPSSTPYLVWTNIDSQRTYIFQGSNHNWKLIKHFICSTGRDYTPTPKGEFKLTSKVPYFGVEKGYRCKNAFGFIGTTYLYHSIIFDKTGTYLLEGKGVLGTKASQGCIRFSVENSEWFYNNMLSGTKVWIN